MTQLPTSWSRLHALSPLVRSARTLSALAALLATEQAGRRQQTPVWIDLVAVGLALVAGVVSWLVTRWRIHDGELQVESGLVRRQSVRVPLQRLQAVDIVRPLLGRVLGLAEVRVVVAGHATSTTRLSYLPDGQAEQVRAQLLALAHGLDAATPEPAERPLLMVRGPHLVAATLVSSVGVGLVALVVLAFVLAAVAPRAAVGVAGTTGPLALAWGLAVARRVGAEWDFALADAPDGLRLRAGLLQTRAETIPSGRVQAVRSVQPLLWRPFGWVRLELDLARRHDRDRAEGEAATTTRALLPVGSAAQAHWLMQRVFPGADTSPPARSQAPRRALLRAPLMRHHLHAWHDDRYVICGSGRLRRVLVIVPLGKVQSLRWQQGPLARMLGLADVHVDTAGRHFPGAALLRPVDEASRWVAELPSLARVRRQEPL